MMDYKNRIEFNPNIMLGKPVLKGTRITVEIILRKLSEGASVEELQLVYTSLEKEDVLACLQYASAVIGSEEIIILKAS